MPIPQFETFYSKPQSFEKKSFTFTTLGLYKSYVYWLFNDKKIEEVPVNELLFQLQIISAYVQHTLSLEQNKNTNIIEAPLIPESIKSDTQSHDTINNIIDEYFSDIDKAAYKDVTDASTRYFKRSYNKNIGISGAITAIIIAAAFLPGMTAGGAIALWTIAALVGFFTLMLTVNRFCSDTTKPEISLGKQQNILGNDKDYLKVKRDAIFQAWNPNDEKNKISKEYRTSKVVESLTNSMYPKDEMINIANKVTICAAAHARYLPMYQHANAAIIEESNGDRTRQTVKLDYLTQLMPRPR